MGEERWQKFMEGMEQPCPNSVRMNGGKISVQCSVFSVQCTELGEAAVSPIAMCGKTLNTEHSTLNTPQVPWCLNGYYLPERPDYTLDPLLHAGCYYVQEASSMFLDRVLRQYISSPVRMLDMCAAPGGKTTTAMGALPERSVVVSNEPVRLRANILAENVQKWGCPLNIVTNSYPKDYARSGLLFDVILCDVPCSGEGMFRKDEGAISEWSVANVEKCRQLQREIVADAWTCLRPGGILIYSTCTYNIKEDEENVQWISEELNAEVLPVDTSEEWGITGSLLAGFDAPVYRFIPGISRGEGLFMAVLRKNDGDGESGCCIKSAQLRIENSKLGTEKSEHRTEKSKHKIEKSKHGNDKSRLKPEKFPHQWLRSQEDFCIYRQGDRLVAVHKEMSDLYAVACQSLNIVHAGVTLGELKGRDIIPQQSLALSTRLSADAFPMAELSYPDAITYLRREAIVLPPSVPRGFVVVTFGGHPLGFVKNLGNRANNLYPQEWRIRKH